MLLPTKSPIGHSAKRVTHNPRTTQPKNSTNTQHQERSSITIKREEKWWRYGDQQDASTNKVSNRSFSQACHTQPLNAASRSPNLASWEGPNTDVPRREKIIPPHNVCVYNDLQNSPIYNHLWECVTCPLRHLSLYYISSDLAHKWNKFKIHVLLIWSRWSLDQSYTSLKEESNKNIGIVIWAAQPRVWT